MAWQETNQLWVSLSVGTDVQPLLANICSTECESAFLHHLKIIFLTPNKGSTQLKHPLLKTNCFNRK